MDEMRRMLAETGDRFEMPEPAMERMRRRGEHHEKRQRLAAALVGLAVACAGFAAAFVALTMDVRPGPMAGAAPSPADGDGALVLPIVAIWGAIAVLAYVMVAAVRLRPRIVGGDLELTPRREDPGTARSARRPLVATGALRRAGGNEMDTDPTMKTTTPVTDLPPIRFDDEKVRRTNRWLIVGVVILAIAVVALGVALIAEMNSEEAAPPPPTTEYRGLAQAEPEALVAGFIETHNSGDAAAVAEQYLPDATYWVGGTMYEGRAEIQAAYEELFAAIPELEVEQIGEIVQSGGLVSYLVHDSNDTYMTWVQVWQDGRVAAQWIVY